MEKVNRLNSVLQFSAVVAVFTVSTTSAWAWGLGTLKNQANKATNKVIDKATDEVTKDDKSEDTSTTKPAASSKPAGSSVKKSKSGGPGKGGDRRAFIEKRKREREKKRNTYKISNAGKVDSEPMPPNKYKGKDKADLEKRIREAWKAKYPNDEILAVCFHAENWTRNTNAKNNSTEIYVNDTSVLPVKVIVKTDDKVATIFPAFLNKDHNKNDQIRPGVATKQNAYVIKQMLISNIQ